MKQLYGTLALLLVACGVGAWIYFNERGPAATAGSTVLLRAEPSSVRSVVLGRPDGTRLTLAREGEEWRVRQEGLNAVAVPADEETVKSLLEATQLVESPALIENVDDAKLKELGLARPQSTLLVGDSKIEFGGKPPFDATKIYARVTSGQSKNSQVALVPASLSDFLLKPFFEWRDKSALRLEVEEVSSFTLSTPSGRTRFEETQKADDAQLAQWRVREPVDSAADAGTIITFLQQLPQSKTTQFLEDNPKNLARWGLDKPQVELKVTTDDGVRTLKVGKETSGGFAAQNSFSDAVFVLDPTIAGLMKRPLREWRDKAVLRLGTNSINTIRIKARGQEAKYSSDASGETLVWTREDKTQEARVSGAQVTDISFALQGLVAANYIDKPQVSSTYGFDKPQIEIDLQTEVWPEGKTVQIAQKDGKTYVRLGTPKGFETPVYVVSPDALQSFKAPLDAIFAADKKP